MLHDENGADEAINAPLTAYGQRRTLARTASVNELTVYDALCSRWT